MKKLRTKTLTLILALLTVLLMLPLASCAGEGSGVTNTVQLKLVAGDDVIFNSAVEVDYERPSVLDIVEEASMSAKFEFKPTEDRLGVLLIDKYEEKNEDGTEYYWKYTVNGTAVDNKPGEVTLNDGDKVQFSYYMATIDENGKFVEQLYKVAPSETKANTEVEEIGD